MFHFEDNRRELVSKERATFLLANLPPVEPSSYTAVNLSNKSFSDEAASVIGEALSALSNVTTVNLSDMIAGRPEDEALRVLERICSSLNNCNLVEVDLSDNALGEKGVRACSGVLINKEHLERLFVCNNGMSAAAASLIADILLFRGAAPTKLTQFHFFNNMSGNGGALALVRVLAASPGLVDFRFATTRAGREGSAAVATALAHCPALMRLDLSDNTFAGEGGLALAASLRGMRQLEFLNLRDTGT
jgi:Ran GTPase-activating protein 1